MFKYDHNVEQQEVGQQNSPKPTAAPSRYESQKRRDWNTFREYLKNVRQPPLALVNCSGFIVLEFLQYLDKFGKTKVHLAACHYFGSPNPPHPCACPFRQAWGSLDALIGRLRAAFEENGGKPESNPFGARVVRLYLRGVRQMQAKARGITYEKKKKRKRPPPTGGVTSNELRQHQSLSQGHSETNPLTVHGCGKHSHHSQHSQHSQHSPVSHSLNSYTTNSNRVNPFTQEIHPNNLRHSCYPPNNNLLNPYSQAHPLNAYQDLQLHNNRAGPLLS